MRNNFYAGILRLSVNGQIIESQDACNQPDNGADNNYVYRDFAAGFTAVANPTALHFE